MQFLKNYLFITEVTQMNLDVIKYKMRIRSQKPIKT